ncbi:MAG: transcriptional repressor [Alphaproteobacteria bacterium]|nr:transcriptional repressor [Alphaproteobacteria bacterium]
MPKNVISPKWFTAKHNHEECIASALAVAEKICQKKSLRFTPTRRLVFNLLWKQHTPVGAYELLEMAKAEGYRAAPITIYRALDFLIENGLAHRLASTNSYIGCSCGGGKHHGVFLICRNCGRVLELNGTELIKKFKHSALEVGFKIKSSAIEIEGLCPICSK